MGLASSQARLLLLTARKSDLEYRAQMISQRKIMLAMATEELATDYTRALSNRVLKFVFDQDANENETFDEYLSYGGLTVENEVFVGKYIVTDLSGKMAVPLDKAGKVSLPSDFIGRSITDSNGVIKNFAAYYGNTDPKKASAEKARLEALSDEEYYAEYMAQKNKTSDEVKGNTIYELNILPELTNRSMFQNGLKNGGLAIHKLNEKGGFDSFNWTSSTNIKDVLNTSDDAVAQSKYEAKALQLQNQDKVLDLELKQIETQHKAIETEYDSVKQVIQKNIETSFKIFANG